MFKPLYVYLIVVGVVGALVVWWSRYRIEQAEKQRSGRIKRLKRFDSIKTSTPLDTPLEEAKDAALESVENRFSVIRKMSFFTIVFLWLAALIFPFLSEVPATAVSVLITIFGVVIGIAARPFIENLISGVVISFSHPVRIGDTVIIDGHYGTIEDITISHTMLKIWNWRRYIIPNSRMLNKELINCTINDAFQWMHVEFIVTYEAELERVKSLAINAASMSKYASGHEDPRFWVMSMDEKGYKCWVAAWAASPVDAWELANDIRINLIKQFKANGIKSHMVEVNPYQSVSSAIAS